MSLSVTVGPLAAFIETDSDPELAETVRYDLEAVNRALQAHGLPRHNEPESLPPLQNRAPISSFPYSWLHHLRRHYAHIVLYGAAESPPFLHDQDAACAPIIEKVASPTHHLLWHSDAEGFYAPIEFKSVIEDSDLPGGLLGSSQQLRRELVLVAPSLGIALGNELSDAEAEKIRDSIFAQQHLHVELAVWILLFESVRLSIDHKALIQFE